MGFSNVGLGLVQGMAHPLGAYYDIPHGVANALLLPIVMEYNTESSIAKYVDIARAMGIKVDHLSLPEAAQAAVDAVKNLAIEVGIPEKLQLLNVKEEDLERLSQSAFEDVCTPGNPREVQLGDILELYKKAF